MFEIRQSQTDEKSFMFTLHPNNSNSTRNRSGTSCYRWEDLCEPRAESHVLIWLLYQ